MSKSAGNVVAPQDVMKRFGADILRLWVSSCDYQFDVRLSQEILKQLADAYRKIRNTFRYMLGNLYDFDPAKDGIPSGELDPLDQWAVAETNVIVKTVREKYDSFEFHRIYQLIHNFCVIQLSAYYFDILKDTFYCDPKDSKLRRSAQTALSYILSRLVKILAPILPFTMEEVWHCFSGQKGNSSIHASEWQDEPWEIEQEIYHEWCDIHELRNAVTPFLEKRREEKIIGASLEAKVYLGVSKPEWAPILKANEKDLARVLVVSQVEVEETLEPAVPKVSFWSRLSNGEIQISVRVEKAEGSKCVRCWNYSAFVGSHTEHPGLCVRCLQAVAAGQG